MAGPRTQRLVDLHARFAAPTAAGLPNARVLLCFPILVLVALVVLVLLHVNGSSTGIFWATFHPVKPDPDLLAGRPRAIRTDEWLVQSSYVVSQVSEGFPRTNHVFPGGMDATIMNDLPTWNWSGVFRPQTWGFLALGLDGGMAVRWWLPAALMLTSVHAFVVSVLPRRPGLAALLAGVVVLQPIVQWWWLPIVPLPVAFAFSAMTAAVWAFRSPRLRGRVATAGVAGYLAVSMAMSIYVPYMIPCLLCTLAFVVGLTVQARTTPDGRRPWRWVAVRLVPLASSGVAVVAVLVAWYLTRRDAITATLGTVYPGQRLTRPGTEGADGLLSLVSGPFQRSLQHDALAGLGDNASEASTSLLVGLFLMVPLVALAVSKWRRTSVVDAMTVSLTALHGLVLAFLFVPGWGPLAHLVGIDRAVPERLRLGYVVLLVVVVVVLVERLDAARHRTPWPWAIAGALVALVSCAWAWARLRSSGSDVAHSRWTVVVCVLLAVALIGVARRHVTSAAVLLLAASLVVGAGVNPLYRGVFDLTSQTEAGRAVVELGREHPGATWVGVGSYLSRSTLVEAGVSAYSGVQTYPPREMWDTIDPDHEHEQVWNRLAQVNWSGGLGEPDPRLGAGGIPDVIDLTFDPCSSFSQEHVDYALVDGYRLKSPCVHLVRKIVQGPARQWIFEVVPPKQRRR